MTDERQTEGDRMRAMMEADPPAREIGQADEHGQVRVTCPLLPRGVGGLVLVALMFWLGWLGWVIDPPVIPDNGVPVRIEILVPEEPDETIDVRDVRIFD